MRMMPRLSGAVMAHPRRRREAEVLAGLDATGRLRVVLDPEPEGPPTALRTAAAAWAAVEPGATHHLVLQDDVQLADGFFEHAAEAARVAPDDAVAFYTNWNSRNGAAVRAAALTGASWAEALDEYAPCVALMLPAQVAAGYGGFAAGDGAGWPYDVLMYRHLRASGTRLRIAVPNTVEHSGLPSIAGNAAHGLRRAAVFAAAAPGAGTADCAALTVVPFLKHGTAQCAVRTGSGSGLGSNSGSGSGSGWEYLETERYLRRAGWSLRAVRADFEAAGAAGALPPRAAWNTWLTAFALGTALRAHGGGDAPHGDAALRTLGPGGVCDDLSPAQIESAADALHALSKAGVEAGRSAGSRLRRTGVTATVTAAPVTAVTGAGGDFARGIGLLLGDLGHAVHFLPGPVSAADLRGCDRVAYLADGLAAGGTQPPGVDEVLRAAAEAGVRRLVYVGTAAACGGTVVPEGPLAEPDEGDPGRGQWLAESAVARWAAQGRTATVLRTAEPVGPHAPAGTVTADWILRAWTRRDLPLESDRLHQLVDHRDLAAAVHAALTGPAGTPGAAPQVVHIVSAVHDEDAWAAQVAAVTRPTARTVPAQRGSGRLPALETGLAGALLGWKPTAPLADGLRAQAQWLAYDTECC
ncbi:Nucleoside-diphosphate-sugar epimerase [Actinacidiphila bryophytorum]|uniref:Nucleoside-diphosphate-sugar epimerase n=2 Tax=Actinacidiphila bryophytorum TaxID=1436133 RepID=A0A9W4ECH3_9ACTN|nr:Nucleoside-diphosphate-sugar epimerase [Actinacidiphila bryophytorum]